MVLVASETLNRETLSVLSGPGNMWIKLMSPNPSL